MEINMLNYRIYGPETKDDSVFTLDKLEIILPDNSDFNFVQRTEIEKRVKNIEGIRAMQGYGAIG